MIKDIIITNEEFDTRAFLTDRDIETLRTFYTRIKVLMGDRKYITFPSTQDMINIIGSLINKDPYETRMFLNTLKKLNLVNFIGDRTLAVYLDKIQIYLQK